MTPSTLKAMAGSPREGDDWVERVRAASDIVEVIGQTVSLKRVGRNWVGLCPFHQEKTPSFSVHPERQFYHCFSCKAGGDVFRFIQESEKIGFLEAVELLSRRAGIPIPERRGPGPQRRPLLDALEAAAAAYEQWLADPRTGAEAQRHLEQRGIATETVRTFRLGVAPNEWEALTRRLEGRFDADSLVEAGLAARRDSGRGVYDRFRGRLMIPLVQPGGTVVGFGARSLESGQEPKYLNSPETQVYRKRAFLFGLEQARRATDAGAEMIVVEGYFDAMALHQDGIRNVVATSGTALAPEQARLLQRAVSTVVLTYDGDAAGQDAMHRSLGTLLHAGLDVRVVTLPPGEDPDLLVRKRGADGWREARRGALDPIEFVERHGLRREAGGDPRERALQAVVALAGQVEDPVRQRLLLERASQVFGIQERVLVRAVQLRRSGERSEAPIRAAVRVQATGDAYAERELLRALLQAPQHLAAVQAHLTPEDLHDPAASALARSVWSRTPPDDPAAQALERELLAASEQEEDWEAVATGAARRLKRRRLERQRRDIRRRLMGASRERPGETEESRELLQEYQHLTELMRELDREEKPHRPDHTVTTN